MIKIAVLDDDQNELSSVLKLLEAFQREHTEYSVTVMSFTEPFALLEYTHDHGGFDVYLLDIIMRNLTGIECAQKLRERGDSGEIIFLTVSHEYGIDAFGVNAVGYLLKLSAAAFGEIKRRRRARSAYRKDFIYRELRKKTIGLSFRRADSSNADVAYGMAQTSGSLSFVLFSAPFLCR